MKNLQALYRLLNFDSMIRRHTTRILSPLYLVDDLGWRLRKTKMTGILPVISIFLYLLRQIRFLMDHRRKPAFHCTCLIEKRVAAVVMIIARRFSKPIYSILFMFKFPPSRQFHVLSTFPDLSPKMSSQNFVSRTRNSYSQRVLQ